MVGASKILTVSYGTFSCTLEGFDDSFATMKAIAEYFRDLAADDRYFGAEPPTPDADMLARIAEREVQKRVDARVSDSGVVLRASEEEETRPIAAPVPAPTPAPAREAAAEAAPAEEPAPAPETSAPEPAERASVQPAAGEEGGESVAAKLDRIRAVVARNQGAAPAYPEGEHAEATTPASEDEEDVADDEDGAGPETAETAQEPEATQTFEATVEEPTAQEDEVEAGPVPAEAAEAEPGAGEDASMPVHAESEEPEAGDEGIIAAAARRARVIKMSKAEFEETFEEEVQEEEAETTAPEEEAEATERAEAPHEEPVLGETSLSPEEEAELLRELASVETGEAEEFETEQAETAQADEAPARERDDEAFEFEEFEDEFEDENGDEALQAALGAALRDHARARGERSGREILAEESAEDDAGVDRLLQETNSQLDSPETSRRRSAISHLRAAVAATVADRKSAPTTPDQSRDDEEAYRADLAEVMRPRHREGGQAQGRAERAAGQTGHGAPLMLVSEQRIDTPEDEASAGPVRPRRIARSAVSLRDVSGGGEDRAPDENDDGNIFAADTSFEEFAQGIGAVELADILEAAAAYTRYVEGQPSFKRTRVMSLASDFIGRDSFSREDGLRAFGQLLRASKIVKVKRGQFQIADETRFSPEARIAG